MEKLNRKTLVILLGILALAAFLRFYRFTQHDVINDEVFYGYRSIGLIDSLNSPYQSTPFEWYQPVPAWATLSFHDHPALGFWIQHLSFESFGVNLAGLRAPFALAGIFSVLLVFLIAKKLFGRDAVALLAAGILAVNNYHIWISRVGLQESLVIFFLLLSTWAFLKTLENEKYFYWWVATIGLALMMKYTGIVLLPVFLTWLLWKRRNLLTWRRVGLGSLLLLAIISPIIIYNLALYHARHHFDFQISFFLKEKVAEWQVRPGREVGGFTTKLKNLVTRTSEGYGLSFSILSAWALALWYKFRRESPLQFILIFLLWLMLMILAIGPQERFLAMFAPFLVLLIAGVLWPIFAKYKLAWILFGVLLAMELAFSINTNLAVTPRGPEKITYSILRRDENIWGYNQLETYLETKMAGKYAPVNFPLKFGFANDLSNAAIKRAKSADKTPHELLLVTDSSLSGFASLWYFTRHSVYDGWPVLDDQAYLQATANDPKFFEKEGIVETIFIKGADTLLEPGQDEGPGIFLEDRLQKTGLGPIFIKSPQGKTAFRVYDF